MILKALPPSGAAGFLVSLALRSPAGAHLVLAGFFQLLARRGIVGTQLERFLQMTNGFVGLLVLQQPVTELGVQNGIARLAAEGVA